jgi:hypothetical protein
MDKERLKTLILLKLLRVAGRRKSDKMLLVLVALLLIEQVVPYLQLLSHIGE